MYDGELTDNELIPHFIGYMAMFALFMRQGRVASAGVEWQKACTAHWRIQNGTAHERSGVLLTASWEAICARGL